MDSLDHDAVEAYRLNIAQLLRQILDSQLEAHNESRENPDRRPHVIPSAEMQARHAREI
jgi:hypothetical protein